MNSRVKSVLIQAILVAGLPWLVLGACQAPPPPAPSPSASPSASSPAAPPPAEQTATATATQPASHSALKLGLPFKADVQFTPFYVAQAKGYFTAAGLDVELQYGDESNFLRQLAAGQIDAVVASGEQVILARSAELPVTYIMTWYQRFPVAVFSTNPSIQKPADLVGRTVGLPAESGASFLGWQAFLAGNGLKANQVKTEVVGYQQREAIESGRVDAAVGYVVNEPLQLKAAGKTVQVMEIADTFNLVSNGLVVAASQIESNPGRLQALTTATLQGIRDTIDDPDAAFETALKVVPEAGDAAVRATQRQVLEGSLRFWQGSSYLGLINAGDWAKSQEFLLQNGLVQKPSPIEALIDPQFASAAKITLTR